MTMAGFRPPFFLVLSLFLAGAGALAVACFGWEGFGAPLLALLAAGGAAFGLALLDSPAEERRFVARLFLAALGVRLLAAVLFRIAVGGDESYLYSDSNSYDRVAWVLAQAWRSPAAVGGVGPVDFILDDMYPRLLAGLYFLLGRAQLAAVVLNTVFGASSVYLVYRIGILLLDPVTARWAGWLTAFYTGFWLWEMMTMKDALFLFLILLFFLGLYRVWSVFTLPGRFGRRILSSAAWIAVLGLIFLAAGELRDYMPPILACSALLLPVLFFLRGGGPWRWGLAVGSAAAAVLIFGPWISSRSLPGVALGSDSLLGQATEVPDTRTVGVFLDWIIGHPSGFARYMFLAAVSTGLAPYAWLVPGSLPEVSRFENYMIAYPGMWMWYVLIPFALFGLVQTVRRTKGEIGPVVFYAAAVFLMVSVFIPREHRHRDMMMPVALLLAASGLVHGRKWWALGLAVWIPLVGFIAWKLNSAVPILLAAGAAAAGVLFWHVRIRRRESRLMRIQ